MKQLLSLLFMTVFFCSCKKSSSPNVIAGNKIGLVLNEGNFNFGNASVTSFDMLTGIAVADQYKATNQVALGDVVQSCYVRDSTGYLVVNNSAKITAVSLGNNLKKRFDIVLPGSSPRYMTATTSGKAFITELYANKIWLADLTTNNITGSIPVSGWTEQLALIGNQLFVVQRKKLGGADAAALLVIDANSNQIIQTISLPTDPNGMVVNSSGTSVFVMCEAKSTTPARIYSVDVASLAKTDSLIFSASDKPSLLTIDRMNRLYFANQNVYRISGLKASREELIHGENQQWYGLGIDANYRLFASDAIDYVQSSNITCVDSTGRTVFSFRSGINANGFVFPQ
ncbi:MAG: hypothetical protein U0T84_00765 [Chitinophagales bacterium]